MRYLRNNLALPQTAQLVNHADLKTAVPTNVLKPAFVKPNIQSQFRPVFDGHDGRERRLWPLRPGSEQLHENRSGGDDLFQPAQ